MVDITTVFAHRRLERESLCDNRALEQLPVNRDWANDHYTLKFDFALQALPEKRFQYFCQIISGDTAADTALFVRRYRSAHHEIMIDLFFTLIDFDNGDAIQAHIVEPRLFRRAHEHRYRDFPDEGHAYTVGTTLQWMAGSRLPATVCNASVSEDRLKVCVHIFSSAKRPDAMMPIAISTAS